MANRDQLAILNSGIERWNAWRLQNFETTIDLRNADLRGVDVSQSILSGADLRDADLQYACLHRADLRFANLSRANLAQTDLSNARVGWTTFGNVDLSQTTGLETVRHFGPSTIGLDTVYTSQGRIPGSFLAGAGVPETFIPDTDARINAHIEVDVHVAGNPTPFHSCFISHATADTEFVDRLYADLRSKQIRCWYAPSDLAGGQKLYAQIRNAIQGHDKLLLILSASSINSQWVQTEIWEARQQELATGKRKLFPISLLDFDTLRNWRCFDADSGRDMAREVREYFVPDFSRWQEHDGYQQAFRKLVADLRYSHE